MLVCGRSSGKVVLRELYRSGKGRGEEAGGGASIRRLW